MARAGQARVVSMVLLYELRDCGGERIELLDSDSELCPLVARAHKKKNGTHTHKKIARAHTRTHTWLAGSVSADAVAASIAPFPARRPRPETAPG